MKMRQPHIVPLSRQALTIFRDVNKETGGEKLVFPSLQTTDTKRRNSNARRAHRISVYQFPANLSIPAGALSRTASSLGAQPNQGCRNLGSYPLKSATFARFGKLPQHSRQRVVRDSRRSDFCTITHRRRLVLSA